MVTTKIRKIVEEYYDDGTKKSEYVLVNDQMEGLYKTWNKFGKLIEEAEYVAGKKHGLCKTYFDNYHKYNCLKSGINFKNGLEEGEAIFYHQNKWKQKIQMKGQYKNGKKEGKFICFNEKGKVDAVMNYEEGELHGPFKEYFPNDYSREKICAIYKNGKNVSTILKITPKCNNSWSHWEKERYNYFLTVSLFGFIYEIVVDCDYSFDDFFRDFKSDSECKEKISKLPEFDKYKNMKLIILWERIIALYWIKLFMEIRTERKFS